MTVWEWAIWAWQGMNTFDKTFTVGMLFFIFLCGVAMLRLLYMDNKIAKSIKAQTENSNHSITNQEKEV